MTRPEIDALYGRAEVSAPYAMETARTLRSKFAHDEDFGAVPEAILAGDDAALRGWWQQQ